jgi:orotate phosphoribosyltransferase
VVVDDVVTTAGSTLQAIRAIEEIGCRVVAVLCLVDREEGGLEALSGYRFCPLFRVSELLDDQPPRRP